MKTTWLEVVSSILDRLLISSGYSALNYLKNILKTIAVSKSTQTLFSVASTCVFGYAALYCEDLEGLQNVLIMITADSFSAGVPLPQEPSGKLVMLAVLAYFAVSALLMQCMYAILAYEKSGAALEKIIQWVVLFVGARGLVRFQALGQEQILGITSVVYMLLPTEKYRIKLQWMDNNSTGDLWMQMMECLLNRGLVLWLMNAIEQFTGVSSTFPNIFFFLIVLMWIPIMEEAKCKECMGVFSFMTARKLVQGLRTRLNDGICYAVLLSALVCMMVNGDDSSALVSTLVLAIGMLSTKWLETWVGTWSEHTDWILIYLVIFVVLQWIKKRVKTKETTKTQAHRQILEVGGVLAHHEALLGLPLVEDLSGQH